MSRDRFLVPLIAKDEAESSTHIEVSVYYTLGGANYFNGGTDPRGIYAGVSPIRVGDGFERRCIGHGVRRLLESVNRKKPARLAELYNQIHSQVLCRTGLGWEMVQRVATQYHLTLMEDAKSCQTASV